VGLRGDRRASVGVTGPPDQRDRARQPVRQRRLEPQHACVPGRHVEEHQAAAVLVDPRGRRVRRERVAPLDVRQRRRAREPAAGQPPLGQRGGEPAVLVVQAARAVNPENRVHRGEVAGLRRVRAELLPDLAHHAAAVAAGEPVQPDGAAVALRAAERR